MTATQGSSAHGCLLQSGDGGVGAGVRASKTFGTSNQQLIIFAKQAGTYGNSLTAGIVVSGTSTAFSIVVTETSVLINSATDGGGTATTTVLQAIAALYANATFGANFDATVGVGNGSGVLAAGASAALTSGAAGTEVFTTIAEITGFSGPQNTQELIDATHLESTDGFREYLPGLRDGGSITFSGNYLPTNANQLQLSTDLVDGTRRNYRVVWSDAGQTTDEFGGYVVGFTPSAQLGDKLSFDGEIKITGAITRLP